MYPYTRIQPYTPDVGAVFAVVAEQICLLDSVYFRAVPKSELLLCDELSGKDVQTKVIIIYDQVISRGGQKRTIPIKKKGRKKGV